MPLPLVQPTAARPIFAPAESSKFSVPGSLLNHWHLVSLDAPTVAVTWTFAFAWIAQVHLPMWVPILTGLVVWSVYVGDRILDAHSGLREDDLHHLRERHQFHWCHRRILVPLASAAAAAAACIIFSLMPLSARQRDSFLAAASLLYFTRVHTGRSASPLISKELLVGLLFTVGCVLPACSRAASPLSLLAPAAFFILLAWLNCHAIERWESTMRIPQQSGCLILRVSGEGWESTAPDLASFNPPQPRIWGPGSPGTLATLLALAGIALSALLALSQARSAALTACGSLSALLLALLDRCRNRIPAVTLRAAADLVLLTPLLLVPIAALLQQ